MKNLSQTDLADFLAKLNATRGKTESERRVIAGLKRSYGRFLVKANPVCLPKVVILAKMTTVQDCVS